MIGWLLICFVLQFQNEKHMYIYMMNTNFSLIEFSVLFFFSRVSSLHPPLLFSKE